MLVLGQSLLLVVSIAAVGADIGIMVFTRVGEDERGKVSHKALGQPSVLRSLCFFVGLFAACRVTVNIAIISTGRPVSLGSGPKSPLDNFALEPDDSENLPQNGTLMDRKASSSSHF
jgi:hypothetical protein